MGQVTAEHARTRLAPSATSPADSAWHAVRAATEAARPAGLEQVVSEAALQTRVDTKYLLTPSQFTDLVARMGPQTRVLDIDGRRISGYESVYFDTPDLEHFKSHRQGRRLRYKVRTRRYVDSGTCMFEVKVKGVRGATVKHRIAHPRAESAELTGDARAFLDTQLRRAYGITAPDLVPALRSGYERATFVDLEAGERMTCDVNLIFESGQRVVHGPEMIVVEVKTADGAGAADRILAEMGVQEVSMSKYCIGTALVHPHLAANRWNRLLRTHFGWRRANPAA